LADPEGGALQVRVTAQPTSGTLAGPDDAGEFTYSPRANFHGSDAFSIAVTDTQGLSTLATVALSVTSVNDTPTADNDSAMVAPGSAVIIPVLRNDSDVETPTLQARVSSQSPNGTAQVQTDGSIMFIAAAGFAGTTQFQYQAVDADGGASAPATVSIQVRPLKDAVYYTAGTTDPRVLLNTPLTTRRLSSALSAGSTIEDLQVSANSRTALWRVRPQATYNDAWYYIDLVQGDATEGSLGGTKFFTQMKLSPTGTHVLIPHDELVGFYVSTVVDLQALWGGSSGTIHSAPATDQVAYYWFSPDGQSVIYRTNVPTQFDTDVNYYRVSLDATASPLPLAHSFPATEQAGTNLKVTPDGSRIVFDGYLNNWTYPVLRTSLTDGSTNAQVVGPTITAPNTSISNFEIASDSRHVAFTSRNSSVSPADPVSSHVIDLETGGYAQIGTGFTTSHRVTQPAFNPDGTRLALGISSGSETAIYEASVQNPSVLTRVGSVHEGRVVIGQVQYATDGRVVYAADVRQAGVYELFVGKDGESQRLNADLGTSVFTNSAGLAFRLSSDRTSVAYAQPATAAAPKDLYLIDVTTPGLPLQIGANVAAGSFNDLAYAILN
jgi:WD40 repeat protein